MLLSHFKVCLLSEKQFQKNIEIHSFLGLFRRFPVDGLEDEKKTEFQICFVARNLNEEHRSIILQTKISPDDFKSIATLSLHKMFGWKMVAMISLKMRNLGFEIFFESGFSDGNNCFK